MFSKGDGSDFITDFGAAGDHILLTRGFNIAGLAIQQAGADPTVMYADASIRHSHTSRPDMTAADFIFGGKDILGQHLTAFFEGWTFSG